MTYFHVKVIKKLQLFKSYQTFTAMLLGEKKQLREVVAPLKRFVRPTIRSTENLDFDPKNWLSGPPGKPIFDFRR